MCSLYLHLNQIENRVSDVNFGIWDILIPAIVFQVRFYRVQQFGWDLQKVWLYIYYQDCDQKLMWLNLSQVRLIQTNYKGDSKNLAFIHGN